MIGYDDTLKRLVHRDNNAWREVTTAIAVRKTANETVNNNNALQNDDDLKLALAANEVWAFHFVLVGALKAASDLQLKLTVPAGASGYSDNLESLGINGIPAVALGTAFNYAVAADSIFVVHITGFVANGANAGDLQLQWAQVAAVAEDTTIRANSYLLAHRLL
jgi:hypothetical protein